MRNGSDGRSRLGCALLMSLAPLSCAFEAEDEAVVGESQSPVLTTTTLEDPVTLDCEGNAFTNAPQTQFTVALSGGDMVWVAGDSTVQYSQFGSFDSLENSTIDGVLTYLSCHAGLLPDTESSNGEPPRAESHMSRSSQNVWAVNPSAPYGNLQYTHRTRAIFTAPPFTTGPYTCWMTYGCWDTGTNTAGQIRFLGTSTLRYYSTNQYPGQSWNQPRGNCLGDDSGVSGCKVLSDPVTHAPVTSKPQEETWIAGPLSSGDTEVVATWSPLITNCIDPDLHNERCDWSMMATNSDTYFRWRLGVYQRNNGTTCNKAFGAWSNPVLCDWRTHHCGADIYTTVFPIIADPQMGTEGSCGSSTANRNFKVFAQIRKANGEDNDLVVEGGTYSNLMIYSR